MTPSASHAQRAAELAFLLPRLRRFARVLTRRTEDADELVRAALQRALAPQWQAGGPLDDAVFRLIKTAWLEAPEARTGASRAHGESLDSAIDQAVAALPVRQRLLVALVLVDGRSYRQAAAIFDMPVGEIGAELARSPGAAHEPAGARQDPPMKLLDETLMAYADGELDESVRRQVEQAMQADPAVAARVEQHRALRQQLQRAYAPLLEAAPPARLNALLAAGGKAAPGAPPPRPKVVHLDSVRNAHGRRATGAAAGAAIAPAPLRWPWQIWLALATALFVGIGAGVLGVTGYHSETQFAAVNGNGMLRAHGKLDAALDGQLASVPQPRGNLRVGVSFVGRDGQYCRAFELGAAAGLACRAGAGWNIPVLVEGQGAAGGYRAVGSALPAAVMAAIDARAVGPALDAAAERAAAARGWSR